MAKRFIDTNIFSDDWFMDLSKDSKLLYIYLITNCDHAGIFKLNTKLVKFQTDIKDLVKCFKELSKCLITIGEQYPNTYFLPKFIKFQYPNFPNSRVKQQESALKILDSYNIDLAKCYLTLKEHLPKCYGSGSGNDSVIVIDNGNVKTWRNDFEIYLKQELDAYYDLIENDKFFEDQQKFNPNIDLKLTLEKAHTNYWSTEAGWKNKKKSRSDTLDWKATFTNSLSQKINFVYKSKEDKDKPYVEIGARF